MSEIGTENRFAPPRAHVDDQVVTHDEMVPATRLSRLLAALLDWSPFIVLGVIAGVVVAMAMPGVLRGVFDPQSDGLVAIGLMGLAFLVVVVGWLIWNLVLLYNHGQTFGKRMMRIRMVRTDGSRLTLLRFIFLRWLPIALLGWVANKIGLAMPHHPLYYGYVVRVLELLLIFGASRRCLHDLIAGSMVVTAETSEGATLAGSRGVHLRSANF